MIVLISLEIIFVLMTVYAIFVTFQNETTKHVKFMIKEEINMCGQSRFTPYEVRRVWFIKFRGLEFNDKNKTYYDIEGAQEVIRNYQLKLETIKCGKIKEIKRHNY